MFIPRSFKVLKTYDIDNLIKAHDLASTSNGVEFILLLTYMMHYLWLSSFNYPYLAYSIGNTKISFGAHSMLRLGSIILGNVPQLGLCPRH